MGLLSSLSLYLGKNVRVRVIVPSSSFGRFKTELAGRFGSKAKIVLTIPNYWSKSHSALKESYRPSKKTAAVIEIPGSKKLEMDNFVAEFGKRLKEEHQKNIKPPKKKEKKEDVLSKVLQARREARASENLKKRPRR